MELAEGVRGQQGEGQGLTAVGVVLPAGQGSACLLAGHGVPAEDLAAQLLLVFGVPGDTQFRHTFPGGAAGTGEGEGERRTLSLVASGLESPKRKTSGSVGWGFTRDGSHKDRSQTNRERDGQRDREKRISQSPGPLTHPWKGSGATVQ